MDRLTLRLINERILTAGDFARRLSGASAGSVVLMPDSLPRYLENYEAALTEPRKAAPNGMREVLRAQVENLAGAIRKPGPFLPYLEEA